MYTDISPEELQQAMIDQKELNIVDVREEGEVAAGKIPGAKNIPLGQLLTRTSEFDTDKEYIMVCRSGNRSSLACEWLSEKGLTVKNLTGGMMSWQGQTE